MNQLMKLFYCLFIILFVLSCSTDDGGSEMDNKHYTRTNSSRDIWKLVSDFTNQTSDFTQTRTGSQGHNKQEQLMLPLLQTQQLLPRNQLIKTLMMMGIYLKTLIF